MNIDLILNDCLNKALCTKRGIKRRNSNEIASFVTKFLKESKDNNTIMLSPNKNTKDISVKYTLDFIEDNIKKENNEWKEYFQELWDKSSNYEEFGTMVHATIKENYLK